MSDSLPQGLERGAYGSQREAVGSEAGETTNGRAMDQVVQDTPEILLVEYMRAANTIEKIGHCQKKSSQPSFSLTGSSEVLFRLIIVASSSCHSSQFVQSMIPLSR